jgi:hypothetical protein
MSLYKEANITLSDIESVIQNTYPKTSWDFHRKRIQKWLKCRSKVYDQAMIDASNRYYSKWKIDWEAENQFNEKKMSEADYNALKFSDWRKVKEIFEAEQTVEEYNTEWLQEKAEFEALQASEVATAAILTSTNPFSHVFNQDDKTMCLYCRRINPVMYGSVSWSGLNLVDDHSITEYYSFCNIMCHELMEKLLNSLIEYTKTPLIQGLPTMPPDNVVDYFIRYRNPDWIDPIKAKLPIDYTNIYRMFHLLHIP